MPDTTPTINTVMDEFLDELAKKLSERTCRGYNSAAQLLQSCIDGYGPNYLADADKPRWDEACKGGSYPVFCDLFGPEYIPQLFDEFMSYFLPRKVQPSKALAGHCEKLVKKLGPWLVEKGYVNASRDVTPTRSYDLVGASELNEILWELEIGGEAGDYPESAEGHFYIQEIHPTHIVVDPIIRSEPISIALPPEAIARCTTTMAISGVVVRRGKGWHFAEVWNVYP